jgi:precorrin-6A/cobalt-precorrin-6A reductase
MLRDAGIESCLHTLTQFGSELAGEDAHAEYGEFSEDGFRSELSDYCVVVDATHPFATRISSMAMRLCAEMGLHYLRFERPCAVLPDWAVVVHSHREAAERAVELAGGKRIFLAIGSREIKIYAHQLRAANAEFVARVLPTSAALLDCEEAGLSPSEIVAMFGVPERGLETALLRHYDAGVVVTKESGNAGGVEEKLEAARLCGAVVVVVIRPPMTYPWMSHDMASVVARVRECLV